MNCTACRSASSTPKRRAFRDMRDRHVERALGFRNIVHAVPQPAVSQPMLAHVEAVALAAEQIVGRHLEIPDLDFGMTAMDHVGVRAFLRSLPSTSSSGLV